MPLIEAKLADRPKPGIMLYSFATAQADEVYREISSTDIDAVFIAGGPHPSAKPKEALEYFDFVVIGEGEETLPELIRTIENHCDPGDVLGIAYRRDGEIVFTDHRPQIDLDRYPPFGAILAPIEISRGCPWECAYCQTPRLCGKKMRHRSVPTILRYARYHRDIRFTSPNSLAYGSDGLTPRLDKVESLLKGLAEQKKPIYFGTFPSEVRPEFVSARALELITSYCQNSVLSIGGQSGSSRILEAISRGHSVSHLEEACQLCSDHGITPIVDFIFGLPMETALDQLQSLELVRWIVGRGGKVRAHYFTPLPGTPLYGSKPEPVAVQVAAKLGRLALQGDVSGRWMAISRTS